MEAAKAQNWAVEPKEKKNFAVVFYGCKNLSLTLDAEYRLRVFETRVLGRIFVLKRNEPIGSLRKLRNL
jgi:hypothetical protein